MTTIDRHDRPFWSRGRWIGLAAVLAAVVVALVLVLVFTDGSGGGSGGVY
jgi:cell division protein FtsX